MRWPCGSKTRMVVDVAISGLAVVLAVNHLVRPGGARSPGNALVVLAGLDAYWCLVWGWSRRYGDNSPDDEGAGRVGWGDRRGPVTAPGRVAGRG